MNNKLKAILIIAVFALICIGSYSIFEPAIHLSYERINLTQSCTAEVPVTDKSSDYVDNLGIEYYSDYEHNLNITSFNTENNITFSQGNLKMERIKLNALGHQKVNESGVILYRNDDLDNYGIFVDDKRSHNQILITSTNSDILIRVYKSLQASVLVNSTDDFNYNNSGSHYSRSTTGMSLPLFDFLIRDEL